MKRTYEMKSNQPITSVKPTTLNLQTRGFAPPQSESDEDVPSQTSKVYQESILEKLISTPASESSAASIQRKPQNRLKANRSRDTLVQAKLNIGEPNDKYEKEADDTASKVVQQINSPAHDSSVQRQESMEAEEEELQMKPVSSIQREEMSEEEEELQMKPDPIQRAYSSGGKINRFPSEEMDVTTEIDEARQIKPASIRHTDVLSPKINRAADSTLLGVDPRVSPMKNQNSDLNVSRKVNRQTDTTDTIDTSDFDVQTIQRQPHITAAPQSTIQRDNTNSVHPKGKKKALTAFVKGAFYNKDYKGEPDKPDLPRWKKNEYNKLPEDQKKIRTEKYFQKNSSLRVGEGVRSFLLETFCGPFMYISSYRRKKFTDAFSENKSIYSGEGKETVDDSPHKVLQILANSEKVLGEVAKTIGWIGLVCGISSFIAAAIPFGQPAAAVLGAIATVAGLTTAGISLVRLILNTILAVKNLGFHTEAMKKDPRDIDMANNARKQTYKHFAQAIANIISLISTGAGLGITFGAGSGIDLGGTLSSPSNQPVAEVAAPKVASIVSTTARGLPMGFIGKGVEEGMKQIGKHGHDKKSVNLESDSSITTNSTDLKGDSSITTNSTDLKGDSSITTNSTDLKGNSPNNLVDSRPTSNTTSLTNSTENDILNKKEENTQNFIQLKPTNDLFLQRNPDEGQENENAQELASAKIEAHKVIQDNVMGTLESGRSASNKEKSEIGKAEQNLTTGGTNLNQLVKENSELKQQSGEMDSKAKEGDKSLNVEVDGAVSKSEKLENKTQAKSEQEKLNKLDEKITEVEAQGGISNDKEKLNWKQKLKNKLKSGWNSTKEFFFKAYGNLKARLKKIFAAIQLKLARMVVKFAGLSEPVQALQSGVSSAKKNVAPSRESIEDSLTSNQETGSAAEQLKQAISGYKG